MRAIRRVVETIGALGLGVVMLGLVVGLSFGGQWVYGHFRPDTPKVVRSLIGGEKELDVREYLDSVPRAVRRFGEEAEKCAVVRDQPCLTRAVEDLRSDIGPAVPASASWMGDSHMRLRQALDALVDVHRRAEAGDRSEQFVRDSVSATEELQAAFEEWERHAQR